MRHIATALVLLLLLTVPVFAVDLGRAEGTLSIDGTKITLNYAYVIARQKNQLNNKNEMTRIILTDKPLPDGAKLADMDDQLPGDLNGVIVCVDKQGRVGHVAIQHPTGNYDGGYFEGLPEYEYKSHKGDSGAFDGSVSSQRVKTNTMTFSFEASFSASLR